MVSPCWSLNDWCHRTFPNCQDRCVYIYLSGISRLESCWSTHVWRSSREYPSRWPGWRPSSTISPGPQPLFLVEVPWKSSGLVVALVLLLGYCLTYEEICNRVNSGLQQLFSVGGSVVLLYVFSLYLNRYTAIVTMTSCTRLLGLPGGVTTVIC